MCNYQTFGHIYIFFEFVVPDVFLYCKDRTKLHAGNFRLADDFILLF